MNTASDSLQQLARAHEAVLERLTGGAAWRKRRVDALTRLLSQGLPDRRAENWKYLDWAELAERELAPGSGPAIDTSGVPPLAPGMDPSRTLLLVDGCLASSSLPDIAGVSISSLATAIERDPEEMSRALRMPGDDVDERFALLAEAFTDDGIVIRVADDADAGAPLYIVHGNATRRGSSTRLLVEAGRGSHLQLVEHFIGGAAGRLDHLGCELKLGEGARVGHLRLHQRDPDAAQVESLRVEQAAGSRYQQQLFLLGGRLLRSNLQLRLEGADAEAALQGLFVVDGSRQADLYTLIEHLAARTRSRELVRGIATDRGRGAFNGRILVGPDAVKADSSQSSRNLILSPLAQIDARPQLEILTDDVSCSHGATIGSLDTGQLFYLLSRGIDPDTARGLLTFAFCEDVISLVAQPELRRYIEEIVVGRLPDRDIIKEFL